MNHATDSNYGDRCEMFMIRHEAHLMLAHASISASASNNVWFVDSGASNHMTSHEDWFRELHEPERPGYIETGDDTTHPIQHIGNVPLGNNGNQTYLKNVLHVPTITKKLTCNNNTSKGGRERLHWR